MADDARNLPIALITSAAAFVVFSQHLGILYQQATATEAVRSLLAHLERYPRSDARVYKRSPDAWRIF